MLPLSRKLTVRENLSPTELAPSASASRLFCLRIGSPGLPSASEFRQDRKRRVSVLLNGWVGGLAVRFLHVSHGCTDARPSSILGTFDLPLPIRLFRETSIEKQNFRPARQTDSRSYLGLPSSATNISIVRSSISRISSYARTVANAAFANSSRHTCSNRFSMVRASSQTASPTARLFPDEFAQMLTPRHFPFSLFPFPFSASPRATIRAAHKAPFRAHGSHWRQAFDASPHRSHPSRALRLP